MAEPLRAGNVRDQLYRNLEDTEIVEDFMRRLHLPETVTGRCWLQIPLGVKLWEDYLDTRELGEDARQRWLFASIAGMFRRLSA